MHIRISRHDRVQADQTKIGIPGDFWDSWGYQSYPDLVEREQRKRKVVSLLFKLYKIE